MAEATTELTIDLGISFAPSSQPVHRLDHWSHLGVGGLHASGSTSSSGPHHLACSSQHEFSPYQGCQGIAERCSVRQRPPHCLPIDPMIAPSIPFPGTAPQIGRFYPLSTPDREAKEPYISNLLASGIIHPSSLPAGAGYFFEEKKVKTLKPYTDYDITVETATLCHSFWPPLSCFKVS